MDALLYPIEAVVQRTGLSAHVIRIWEKRYRAVEPARTATNRRQYTDDEIQRLTLLGNLTRAGQSISYLAKLPTDQLRQLTATTPASRDGSARTHGVNRPGTERTAELVDDALTAASDLNAHEFERTLNRAVVALGTQGMLQHVAAPLAQRLGELWRAGTITSAHEHFATGLLRTHLAQTAAAFAPRAGDPVLIVATPPAQLHELGALLVSAAAANLGWRVIHLGASLPAVDIAGAAVQNHARAVALSLVFPEDDPAVEGELVRLRELLPPEVSVIAGGRAVAAYRLVLERINAFQAGDLEDLGELLDRLRRRDPTPSSKRIEDR